MRKTQTILLTTALLFGGLINSFGQSNCGWTLTNVVGQPTCYKVCNGYVSVAPTVGLPYTFTYLWSNGSTSNTISNLCENDYQVTVTDDKGCSQMFTYSIVEPAQLVASCTTLTNESYAGAANGSIQASATGGTGAISYVWQTNPNVYGSLITGLSGGIYYVLVSDANDCSTSTSCSIITEKKEECNGFRTQTQGGWGQCQQNVNNPGVYLFANFATAFPSGLQIGCTNKLKLTSAQAVCDFLPSGTTPKALPAGTLLNPVTYANVLAGQLVTAVINVQFDYAFPSFAPATTNLGDMLIASGPFAGWSVNALIAEANKKIGGCASVWSYSKLNAALTAINENFDNGTVNNGYLVCPNGNRITTANNNDFNIQVYPNPSDNVAFVSVESATDENVIVEVYNISGQKILSAFNGLVEASHKEVVKIDASGMTSGIYFVKVIAANKVYNQKLILKK